MKSRKAKSYPKGHEKIFHYNFSGKNRRAAMEMSVGTIVTIVLLMSVLVLGIFLVQKIFKSSINAIDNVDEAINEEIKILFGNDETKGLIIYPTSRQVTLDKNDDVPKGFAFSVRNKDVESAEFSYTIVANDISNCGTTMTKEKANSYLIGGSGSFSLGPGNSLDLARLVKIDVDGTAPPCTIFYVLDVKKGTESYSTADISVTIK